MRDDQALVGLVEDTADFASAAGQRFRTFGDARHSCWSAASKMRPRSEARAASASADFADAHAEPLVGALEVAQDVAGAGGQRLRRLDGAGNELLVGGVESAGDLDARAASDPR